MKTTILTVLFCGMTLTVLSETVDKSLLPAEEQGLVNTVDPWGLAFSDQLTRFQQYFEGSTNASFVVGYTHNLVKIWRNKYWFRGEETMLREQTKEMQPLWGTAGSVISFQLAILPKTGARTSCYHVSTQSPVSTRIFREEFVKLGPAAYPRLESASWPDPLVPESDCQLSGIDAGVFWVEVEVPPDFGKSHLSVEVQVTSDGGQQVTFTVPIELVRLEIPPPDFHLTAWFGQGKLNDDQFDAMCSLALEHHLEPLFAGNLTALWSTNTPSRFENRVQSLMKRGQRIFQINTPTPALYDFLVEKGWLDRFMIYSNADEPSESTFLEKNIPWKQEIRKNFPGLKIFLASEFHTNMSEGCDILMTDLSSANYDPRTFAVPEKPELWHYYCHLPIHWQMNRPLTRAPNMQIDDAALEHRLALWISWNYKAKGVFIYGGNLEWSHLGADFWTTLDLSSHAYRTAYKTPYGGTHYGNGFLVYPPRNPDGEVLPSIRLKVLRDGMQDIALFQSALQKYGNRVQAYVSPVPDVFQHPHYYDLLPETLLKKREALLKRIRDLEGDDGR